jgi:hypothetical protein
MVKKKNRSSSQSTIAFHTRNFPFSNATANSIHSGERLFLLPLPLSTTPKETENHRRAPSTLPYPASSSPTPPSPAAKPNPRWAPSPLRSRRALPFSRRARRRTGSSSRRRFRPLPHPSLRPRPHPSRRLRPRPHPSRRQRGRRRAVARWWSSRASRGGLTWRRGGCGRSGARRWSRCTCARRGPSSRCSTPTATPPTSARCTSSSSSSAPTSASTSWGTRPPRSACPLPFHFHALESPRLSCIGSDCDSIRCSPSSQFRAAGSLGPPWVRGVALDLPDRVSLDRSCRYNLIPISS